jgi:hypothetical protein
MFNVFGVSTTKYASAAQRSTIDTSRTVFIAIIGWLWLGDPFQPMELIGFAFLIIGTLLYNEIFELPIWGFNENTKRAIKARNELYGEDGDAVDYVATSPHAAYDSNRNKRSLS